MFQNIVKDPNGLTEAVDYLYETLLDDVILGVFFEIYIQKKTGNLEAMDGMMDEETKTTFHIVDIPNYDIFGISTAKKPVECTCPNCDRLVSAARFAPHLEKCMGMGRISSRIASRRLATKESNSASSSSSSSYQQANICTDDEDDIDWSSEKRRKRHNQAPRNNGAKKNNGKTFYTC